MEIIFFFLIRDKIFRPYSAYRTNLISLLKYGAAYQAFDHVLLAFSHVKVPPSHVSYVSKSSTYDPIIT